MTGLIWRRALAIFLRFIYYFLGLTFIAVVVATLAECQTFDHYWQVIPDPGSRCRSGYAQLITMGICDIITDLLLIAFPVPIILSAHMPLGQKLRLVALFCLSVLLIAVTCYRVPKVIEHEGAQPYRSLIASLEILAATAVCNIVVIGSFVHDRGVKKLKWKREHASASVSESMDNSNMRRNTLMRHQWGSDSDLAADLGIRLDPKLCSTGPWGEPNALQALSHAPPRVSLASAHAGSLTPSCSFHQDHAFDSEPASAESSLDIRISLPESLPLREYSRQDWPNFQSSILPSHRVSPFDVGGLLEQERTDACNHLAPVTLSHTTPKQSQ